MFYVMPISSYTKIKQNIDTGNIYIVEGEVSNFSTPENAFGGHDSESFTINNVNFATMGRKTMDTLNFCVMVG